MDKILSIQTIKNVFAALGAKTSDSNYGVALLDKTTAEPKGLMGMSDLASVLGATASKDGNFIVHQTYIDFDNDSTNDYSMGIYASGTSSVDRGYCLRLVSNTHNRIIEINFSIDAKIKMRGAIIGQAWGSWTSVTLS